MRRIHQGDFEIFTTKSDAIDKFRQMRGFCREELSGENHIWFECLKNGKIAITDPPGGRKSFLNSTELSAKIVEREGKTFVTYYTAFSRFNNIYKMILLIFNAILTVFALVITFISDYKLYSIIGLCLFLVLFIVELFSVSKEGENSPKDSEILVKELEKKVEAVNNWDR